MAILLNAFHVYFLPAEIELVERETGLDPGDELRSLLKHSRRTQPTSPQMSTSTLTAKAQLRYRTNALNIDESAPLVLTSPSQEQPDNRPPAASSQQDVSTMTTAPSPPQTPGTTVVAVLPLTAPSPEVPTAKAPLLDISPTPTLTPTLSSPGPASAVPPPTPAELETLAPLPLKLPSEPPPAVAIAPQQSAPTPQPSETATSEAIPPSIPLQPSGTQRLQTQASVPPTIKAPTTYSSIPSNIPSTPYFSPADVAHHNHPSDLWIIIGSEVFDVTNFQAEHPGGAKLLQGVAGKDATTKFRKYHRDALLISYRGRLKVGEVKREAPAKKGFWKWARK